LERLGRSGCVPAEILPTCAIIYGLDVEWLGISAHARKN